MGAAWAQHAMCESALMLTSIVATYLPLDPPWRQMPSAVLLIYSIQLRSRLIICYFLILVIDNSEFLSSSYAIDITC